MGKNQLRLLRFCLKYHGWQSIGPDSRATARHLAALGLLEHSGIKGSHQYRLALEPEAREALEHGFDAMAGEGV